ncbi:hypothetical protein HNQ85_000905 [Anoxybacillus calidus]|uniref:Uncharacterized protein n=1 Tax=[Anoxybacillus] calidus TaxID=575178 RepID=A0A7V9YYM1_9BACL|nr:hypothetical protein [Anoxybacillus calidus]
MLMILFVSPLASEMIRKIVIGADKDIDRFEAKVVSNE